MQVGIISGRYPQTTFGSAINHKVYADVFGYTYIHCNWPTKANNLYLNKIHYLLANHSLFDYLIWIDDDAFFCDFETDIMKYKPQGNSFISLCKSPDFKSLKTYFSSGQFILKCNELSKQFLQSVLNQDLVKIKTWWLPNLGYFTNGDQDIMIYLLLQDETFKNKLDLYNYKCFNSRFENLNDIDVHQPLILHFTGKPDVKRTNYNKSQKVLGLSSTLVPESLLSNYNIVITPKKTLKKRLKLLAKKVLGC